MGWVWVIENVKASEEQDHELVDGMYVVSRYVWRKTNLTSPAMISAMALKSRRRREKGEGRLAGWFGPLRQLRLPCGAGGEKG